MSGLVARAELGVKPLPRLLLPSRAFPRSAILQSETQASSQYSYTARHRPVLFVSDVSFCPVSRSIVGNGLTDFALLSPSTYVCMQARVLLVASTPNIAAAAPAWAPVASPATHPHDLFPTPQKEFSISAVAQATSLCCRGQLPLTHSAYVGFNFFARGNRTDINTLEDLSGKRLVGTDVTDGSIQIPWYEMVKRNLSFWNLPEAIILTHSVNGTTILEAVKTGLADVGMARGAAAAAYPNASGARRL